MIMSQKHILQECLYSHAAVQWLGAGTGFPGGPSQRAAVRTSAGPGPVAQSGWSLTWQSDPAEGPAQGEGTPLDTITYTCVNECIYCSHSRHTVYNMFIIHRF